MIFVWGWDGNKMLLWVYESEGMSCMIGCVYKYEYRHDISIYGNFLIGW